MIERLQNQGWVSSGASPKTPGKAETGGFGTLMQETLDQTRDVTFSKHARSRAQERGIEINQSLIDQLKGAIRFIKQHYTLINRICGSLLIVLGVLMATGGLGQVLRSLS